MRRAVPSGYGNLDEILDLDKVYFMKVNFCSVHLHMVLKIFLCRNQPVDGTAMWGTQRVLELVASRYVSYLCVSAKLLICRRLNSYAYLG
jgi:hypothetical protein